MKFVNLLFVVGNHAVFDRSDRSRFDRSDRSLELGANLRVRVGRTLTVLVRVEVSLVFAGTCTTVLMEQPSGLEVEDITSTYPPFFNTTPSVVAMVATASPQVRRGESSSSVTIMAQRAPDVPRVYLILAAATDTLDAMMMADNFMLEYGETGTCADNGYSCGEKTAQSEPHARRNQRPMEPSLRPSSPRRSEVRCARW